MNAEPYMAEQRHDPPFVVHSNGHIKSQGQFAWPTVNVVG